MRTVAFVRSALFYLAGFAAAAVLAAVLLGVGREHAAPGGDGNVAGSLAMGAWILGATSLPAAAGFAAVACVSRAWRGLPLRSTLAIGAGCGALGYAGWLTGIGIAAGLVVPFPLGALGAALRLVVPGALLGVLAIAAAAALRVPPARPA
jgi:hypothetical protein